MIAVCSGLGAASCGGGGNGTPDEVFEEVVSFLSTPPEGNPARICATLALPSEGATNLPGVVLIPGAEAADRNLTLASVPVFERTQDGLDGTLDAKLAINPPVQVFREIAHALVRRGFAVLRYDNRTHLTTAGSTCGEPPDSGVFTLYASDFLGDSAAAIAYLKSRAETADTRTYAVGHGFGGVLALQHARTRSVRGAVSLAAPASSIDDLVRDRYSRQLQYLRSLPSTPAIQQEIGRLQAELQEAQAGFPIMRTGRWPITQLLLGYGPFYWVSYLEITDRTLQTFAAVQLPLFLAHGGNDAFVPSSELRAFGAPGQTGRVTVREYDTLTHALTAVSASAFERHVDATLLQDLGAWLETH